MSIVRSVVVAGLIVVMAARLCAAACLQYEPAEVALRGKMISRVFPGPPNYESIAAGDRAETALLLELDAPVCVDGNPVDPINSTSERNEPRRVSRRLQTLRGWGHAETNEVSPEVRSRAVRMVVEHEAAHESQWAAITSIAEKIGCTAETLRKWVRQAERDAGKRPGLTTEERERLRQLERENFELRRANEILKKASAYFAQAELDRRAR